MGLSDKELQDLVSGSSAEKVESPYVGTPTEGLETGARKAERTTRFIENYLKSQGKEVPEPRQVRPGIAAKVFQVLDWPGATFRSYAFGAPHFEEILRNALGAEGQPPIDIPLPWDVPAIPTGKGTYIQETMFGSKEVPGTGTPIGSVPRTLRTPGDVLREEFTPEKLGEMLSAGQLPPSLRGPAATVGGAALDILTDPLSYVGFMAPVKGGGRALLSVAPKGIFTGPGEFRSVIRGKGVQEAVGGMTEKFANTAVGRALGKAFVPGFGLPPEYKTMSEASKVNLIKAKLSLDSLVDNMFADMSPSELRLAGIGIEHPEVVITGRELGKTLREKGVDPKVVARMEKGINMADVDMDKVRSGLNAYKDLRQQYRNLLEAGGVQTGTAGMSAEKVGRKELDMVTEALSSGELPSLDIARLSRRYGAIAEHELARKNFVDRALDEFGKKVDPKDIASASEQLASNQYKFYRGHLIPKDINDDLRHMEKVFTGEEATNAFLKYYDAAQNWWKGNITVTTPGFHIRNSMGNAFNSWLAGMNNPKRFADAASVVGGGGGRYGKYSGEEVLRLAQEHGVYKPEGAFIGELAPRAKEHVAEMASAGQLANPFSSRFALVEAGRTVGSSVENNARVALFIDRLTKGDSPQAASRVVKKYLFDYDELAPFEREVMKRVIPFYTWIRKNTALQAEHLFTTPGKYSAVQNLLGARSETQQERLPYEERPKYMRAGYSPINVAVPGVTVGGLPTMAKVDLPVQELELESFTGRSLSPFINAAVQIGSYVRSGITGEEKKSKVPLPEIYKQMYEALPEDIRKLADLDQVKSFITGKPVPAIDPRVREVLLSALPVMTKISRLIPSEEALADPKYVGSLTGTVLGTRIEPIDVRRQKALTTLDRRRQLEEHVKELFRSGEIDPVQYGYARRMLRLR